MIINGITAAPIHIGISARFTYSGKYGYTEDGLGNWEMRLLSGGVLTMNDACTVDIFAVGGGGSGGLPDITARSGGGYNIKQAGGGGGGYTTTVSNYSFLRGDVLTAVIGAGGDASEITSLSGTDGGTTKMFTGTVEGSGTAVISAYGGKGGEFSWSYPRGGDGGSGGGLYIYLTGGGAGGTNGGNGEGTYGGTGQGTTTRAFGEENGELFSGGGGGGAMISNSSGAGGAGGGGKGGGRDGNYIFSGKDALPNTGGGGGGGGVSTLSDDLYVSTSAGSGGSGIIILRNHRSAS